MCDILKSIDHQIQGLQVMRQQYLESHPELGRPEESALTPETVAGWLHLKGLTAVSVGDAYMLDTLKALGWAYEPGIPGSLDRPGVLISPMIHLPVVQVQEQAQ